MKRRYALIAIASIPAISVQWLPRLLADKAGLDESVRLMRDLEGLFTDIATAIDVGETYLTSCGHPDVTKQLLHGIGIGPAAARSFDRKEFDLLRQKDFAQSNTLLVQGWLLARSELCACALLASLHREHHA